MSDETLGAHPTGGTAATSPLNGEEQGGESACYAHLVDDDGRLIEHWKEVDDSDSEAETQSERSNPG